MSWAALLAVGLAAAPVAPPAPPPALPPQGNPSLAKAEKLLDDLDYDGAAVALLQASKTPRNDRKTILRILELQGLIAASLDQKSSALNFFKQLLALDPDYKLNESTTSAEQRAPFKEAKAQLAATGSLRFEVAPARAKPGLVETVVVKVATDPLSQARKVRFWLKVGNTPWKEAVVPVVEGRASVPAGAPAVSFWAELLGEADGQLMLIGTREKPVILKAPAGADRLMSSSGPALDLGGYRPYAIAAGGCGLVAAAVGALFGARAASINPQIAAWSQQHPVTSVRQVDAQKMVDEANASAVIADSLFGAAVVLGAAGTVLWFVEPEKAPGPGAGVGGLRVDVRVRF
ncbi:MAG TPA: hypothetical protein VFA20_14955 [Myxococcaceae bacterium]|nr:hypothetical protein [Myxococcaceae bacterium]